MLGCLVELLCFFVFQYLGNNNYQARGPTAENTIKIERERKTSQDRHRLKESITKKPALPLIIEFYT